MNYRYIDRYQSTRNAPNYQPIIPQGGPSQIFSPQQFQQYHSLSQPKSEPKENFLPEEYINMSKQEQQLNYALESFYEEERNQVSMTIDEFLKKILLQTENLK